MRNTLPPLASNDLFDIVHYISRHVGRNFLVTLETRYDKFITIAGHVPAPAAVVQFTNNNYVGFAVVTLVVNLLDIWFGRGTEFVVANEFNQSTRGVQTIPE
jgi:hypothetical protein